MNPSCAIATIVKQADQFAVVLQGEGIKLVSNYEEAQEAATKWLQAKVRRGEIRVGLIDVR